MLQGHFSEHWLNQDTNPAGGVCTGRGFTISWQNGPLGRGDTRREPNGIELWIRVDGATGFDAFVEDIIQAVISRLNFYQQTRFACQENEDTLNSLHDAARALDMRTRDREARQVEGTHKE